MTGEEFDELVEIIEAQLEPEDYAPPKYSDPGRILFVIYGPAGYPYRRWDLDTLDYDGDSGVMWLSEGQGIDYWLNDNLDLEPVEYPVYFVLEGVTGTYYRDHSGFGDDDEEWEFALCRYATEEEIQTGALP